MIQRMLASWSLVPLPFLKPAWTSGVSWFTYCWSLAWRILSITLPTCEMSAIVRLLKHSLALPLFGIGKKIDLFKFYGHYWVFQICWHIECSTLTASSFRIWNSSTGIPLPPLALFIVMLPKALLGSHPHISKLEPFNLTVKSNPSQDLRSYNFLPQAKTSSRIWASSFLFQRFLDFTCFSQSSSSQLAIVS